MNDFNAVIAPMILFAFLFLAYYACVDCVEWALRSIAQAVRHLTQTDTSAVRRDRHLGPKQEQVVNAGAGQALIRSNTGNVLPMPLRNR